ncbi:hypothetical protein BCF46_2757 [Litoreibacter meonggei]|uniref:Uncharacterized protein n=1 Tax=Litoreibacter meonggei TaxID=1049199 RepID=A0A497VHR9_9RHOB|nr:hypothetical protein [Litoreibacter meonggei]RLJ41787.1 hypothetical protein BCF46_2757 [Litoreibacter meonggei]
MFEWLSSLFAAALPPAVVPDFDLNRDVYQQELRFAQAAEVCVCGTGCDDAPEGGYLVIATVTGSGDAQVLHFSDRIEIDGVPVIVRPASICLDKSAQEPLRLTLLTQAGYPAKSGTPVIDIR